MITTAPRRLLRAGLALAATVAVLSCASPTDEDTRSATAGLPDTLQSLQAETWVLDATASTPTIDGEATVTLAFGDERLFGQAPCNTYQAPFDLDGQDLDVGTVVATQIGCDDAVAAAETAYLGALEIVDEVDATDPTRLELTGDGASLVFDRLDAEDAVLGEWDVTSLAVDDALVSPIDGTEATLRFAPDGALSASAGCNPIATTWEMDRSSLAIGGTAVALQECPEPDGVMEQEAALLAALDATVRVEVADHLTLYDDHEHIVLVAARAPA